MYSFCQYGLDELVVLLKNLQKRIHNVPYKSDTDWGIMVSNGSQDSLFKAFDLLLSPGDSVLVEDPTYRFEFFFSKEKDEKTKINSFLFFLISFFHPFSCLFILYIFFFVPFLFIPFINFFFRSFFLSSFKEHQRK